jgi:hypothetical protein
MGATLAHELAHHFLEKRGVRLPNESENERLTDLATVYIGLGKLTLNGYEPITRSQYRDRQLYTERVGYLSQSEIARIFMHVCRFRSIPVDAVSTNLSDTARHLLKEANETDLKEANETKAQRIISFQRAEARGSLSQLVRGWLSSILRVLAHP